MRASQDFHVEWVEDEAVALNPYNGELHYLNPPAALTYAFIQEFGFERGLQELRKTHGSAPRFEDDLNNLLDDFVEKGLLVDD